jgi:hypothetical protein
LAQLSGADVEKLFDRFTRDFVIDYSINSDEQGQVKFVQALDSYLPDRLRIAIDCGEELFPAASQWLRDIRVDRLPVDLQDREVADQWNKFLSDRVLAMDSIVQINNDDGQPVVIGIDLTVNTQKTVLDKKLAKIQGKKINDQTEFNNNKNFSRVREECGIDKHIILVFPSESSQLPSFEQVLDRLHVVANDSKDTKTINLTELHSDKTLDWQKYFEQRKPINLWKRYQAKFSHEEGRTPGNSLGDLQKITKWAVEDSVGKEKIMATLRYSVWYKSQSSSSLRKSNFVDDLLDKMVEKVVNPDVPDSVTAKKIRLTKTQSSIKRKNSVAKANKQDESDSKRLGLD